MNFIDTVKKSITKTTLNDLPNYLKTEDISIGLGLDGDLPSNIAKYLHFKIFFNVDINENNFEKYTDSPLRLIKSFPLFDYANGKIKDVVTGLEQYIENNQNNVKIVRKSLIFLGKFGDGHFWKNY